MASGLQDDPGTYALTVELTRWMFPYILLISLVSLASGVLNTWRQFAVPAFTPVLLNLSFIIAVLVVSPWLAQPVMALAGAVVVGGVMQLTAQVLALRGIGVPLGIGLRLSQLRQAWADPQVRRIVKQMLPASLAVSVAQVSLIINTQIASHLAPGSVSWISFGDRLMEFPTAMLGVALGTVLLPSLSRANAVGDAAQYSRLLDWGLRITCALALPAAVGLATFGIPLTAMLFHYGRFDAHDVIMTQQAVLGYSIGLLGLIAVKVLAPGFYAKQDIRTPVKIAIAVVVATQLMNLAFVPWLGHAGLPLSIGVGATLNAAVLAWGLTQRGSLRPEPGWALFLVRILGACAVMAALLLHIETGIDWMALSETPWLRVAAVLASVMLAVAVYFGALALMGLHPRMLLRRPA
jgi:putative peptidoglycan lipid II flippase